MSDEQPKSATSVERVFAALVNLEVAGHATEAMGGPRWLGRLVAGLGMAAAGDPSMPPLIQSAGKVVSAPGALTVALLRDHGVPVIEGAANKAKGAAEKVRDAVDAEFTTVTEEG